MKLRIFKVTPGVTLKMEFLTERKTCTSPLSHKFREMAFFDSPENQAYSTVSWKHRLDFRSLKCLFTSDVLEQIRYILNA